MNEHLRIARQPIVDIHDSIVGYEFFYRDSLGECSISDPRHATSAVLVNLLNQLGTISSFGDSPAFINTDGALLLTDILRTLPREKFIFELSSSLRHSVQIHDTIKHYHALGYRFALDNASYSEEYLSDFGPLFPYMEFAKFDTTQTDIEAFGYYPNPFGQMKQIAYKIEFHEMIDAYAQFGVKYFQGYFIAKSHIITQKRVDPKNSAVLALFQLLQSDASIDQIYAQFTQESALSIQLMQFMTSTHPKLVYGSSSLKEVIEKLGKTALMQWLLLIIYSKSGTKSLNDINRYTEQTKMRIELMVKIVSLASDNPKNELFESARMVACISLLEEIFDIPLENSLRLINPSSAIKDALLVQSGLLGRALSAIRKLQSGDLITAELLLKPYGINSQTLEIPSI